MSQPLAWMLLVLSGIADVAWAYATKKSVGFTSLPWTLLSFVLLALFVMSLAKALSILPLGTAYIVWTGIGAIGAMLVGIMFFGEGTAAPRLAFAAVTLIGILGLKAYG